jgi:hypothetical protein
MLEDGGGFEEALGAQMDLMNKQAAQIQSAAKGLASAAGSGFQIEPGAAETLIKACQDSLHELESISTDVMTVGQAPQLGKTPGADVVAPFTQESGAYPHGIAPALDNLKATLSDMITAYQNAAKNYAAHEEQVSGSLKA